MIILACLVCQSNFKLQAMPLRGRYYKSSTLIKIPSTKAGNLVRNFDILLSAISVLASTYSFNCFFINNNALFQVHNG